MSDKLQRAYEIVGDKMEEVRALFLPGVKLTVIVRRPGKPEHDFMMTDDDPDEAVALIHRRIASSHD